MSRYLDEHYPGMDRDKALQKFKANITADLEDKLRLFLSGEIRTQLVSLLRQVEAGTDHVYAALYEFSDEELVGGLREARAAGACRARQRLDHAEEDRDVGRSAETGSEQSRPSQADRPQRRRPRR